VRRLLPLARVKRLHRERERGRVDWCWFRDLSACSTLEGSSHTSQLIQPTPSGQRERERERERKRDREREKEREREIEKERENVGHRRPTFTVKERDGGDGIDARRMKKGEEGRKRRKT
jgi:hypothetical protein